MKYERLNVKLALDLIKNQTQAEDVLMLMGGDSLEFVANHHHTGSPTWVRIDNNEQVKSYQWDSNHMEKVIGLFEIKELKAMFACTKEKEMEMWIDGNNLHYKCGFVTKTTRILPLSESQLGYYLGQSYELWWDFEYAKEHNLENPELPIFMVGCLNPKALNWYKGALIESTELRGDAKNYLWRGFKALRFNNNIIHPVFLDYNKETLTMKWPRCRDADGRPSDCITVHFDVDRIEKPWKGKTTTGWKGTSQLIENLGRLGKGILTKGKMELTVWENALEFNLAIQRTKDSRKVHFRTFIPMDVNRS